MWSNLFAALVNDAARIFCEVAQIAGRDNKRENHNNNKSQYRLPTVEF